ncbi:unnamed protein product [Rotaria sordida]|uniref:Uncharacterized protein n=1 Tax=Rotaria sordida TaxID=392033 RepID=A0A818ZQG8_9BILA|nr:unnamed protein product [Rotaria sordida]CAF1411428.1 unnamed protein product [Rotaria sordida]CAF3772879.1 unnamed protein product [Rotaria sordida]
MTPQQSNEEKVTFILLFSRNQPSCDIPYLMAHREERVCPMLLTATFYFMRDLVDYRAISFENSVYIIGGRYASTGRLSCAVFKYDAGTDFWRTCDSMKAPRINFSVSIFDSKIYVLGGEGLKGAIIQTVEAYDPTIDRWKEVGTLPKPRRNHASYTINGKLWSCGGVSSLLEAQSTNELVIIDPRPNEWKRSLTTFTLPDPRQQHCLTFINNNVLLFGGCQKNGEEVQNIHKIARISNLSSESTPIWEEISNQLQHPRTDCGYFQLGTSLYIVGGYDSETGHPTKMMERIDLTDNSEITIDEQFELDKNLGSVDCCVVQTNKFNEHLLPLASYLDRWIIW